MIALDTNILVYAGQSVPDRRKARAVEIIAAAALVDSIVPTQALVEFAAVCRRKGLLDMTACRQRVTEWALGFRTVSVMPADVTAAIAALDRYRLSFYDALICATSSRAGATVMLSEDMADGAAYDGLRIINPFVPVNDAAIAELLA